MPSYHTYIMCLPVLRKLEKHLGDKPRCRLCGEPIQIGDEVVSFPAVGQRVNHYLYHRDCFEKTLH